MPQRLIKLAEFDFQMLALNITSVTTLIASYVTENLTGFGGFILILSIAALNFAKAYSTVKHGDKKTK